MGLRRTARGIIVRDGLLLMFERWRMMPHGRRMHYFSIPGGGIDSGETPEQAVVREMKEEMGIVVRSERLLVRQTTPVSEHYYFLCKILSGEPAFQSDSPEAADQSDHNDYQVEWVPLAHWRDVHLFPDYRQALGVIKQQRLLYEPQQPVDIDFKRRYTKRNNSNE